MIMQDFLRRHKAKVKKVILTEFNEELYEKMIKKEGYEEGIEKGIEKGIIIYIKSCLKHGMSLDAAIEDTAREFETDEDEIRTIWEEKMCK